MGAHRQITHAIHVFYTHSDFSVDLHFFSYRPRWVVPVLPKGELEVLLEAAIDLSKKGRNIQNVLLCLQSCIC